MSMATMLLLDSRVLLWVLTGDPQLGPRARTAIAQADGVHVSAASSWELTIKSMLGKLVIGENFSSRLTAQGLVPLSVSRSV